MRGTRQLDHWATGGATLLLAAALAGCSSDDDDAPTAGTRAAENGDAGGSEENTQDPGTNGADTGDVVAFCEAYRGVGASFTAFFVPIDAAVAGKDPDFHLAFSASVREHLRTMERTAPAELAEEVAIATHTIRQYLTHGDPDILEERELDQALDEVDAYELAECGYPHVQAVGVDYAYGGLPATMPTGIVAMTFTNDGTRQHDILVARLDDDVTMSFDEVMALPKDQMFRKVAGAHRGFVPPGDSVTAFIRMPPGRYGAVVVAPLGTSQPGEGGGPPRSALGPVTQFTVE